MQVLLFLKSVIVLSVVATILWNHGRPAARQVARIRPRELDDR